MELKAADLMVKVTQVRELVPDLQVSDSFLEQFNASVKIQLLRAAERCRGRGGKRLSQLDV